MRDAAAIQLDLDAAYLSRRAILKAQASSLDTGQGRLSTTRADLAAVNNTIALLEAELSDADGSDVPISFERDSV